MYDSIYIKSILIALGLSEQQLKHYIRVNSTGRGDVSIVFWIHRYVLDIADKYIVAVTEDALDLDSRIGVTRDMDEPYMGCVQEAYMILSTNMPREIYAPNSEHGHPTKYPVLEYLKQCLYKHLVTHSKRNQE